MERSVSGESHEADYCSLQAQFFSELAESATSSAECFYYRELEEIWMGRALSQRRQVRVRREPDPS
jgi:hypothetical protein